MKEVNSLKVKFLFTASPYFVKIYFCIISMLLIQIGLTQEES